MERFVSFCLYQEGDTALHAAAESESDGKEKMVILVENGADVNIQSPVSIRTWL